MCVKEYIDSSNTFTDVKMVITFDAETLSKLHGATLGDADRAFGSSSPSSAPSGNPSISSLPSLSLGPSSQPTGSHSPSSAPSSTPSSGRPSISSLPSWSRGPSSQPTGSPSPSSVPSGAPPTGRYIYAVDNLAWDSSVNVNTTILRVINQFFDKRRFF